MNITSYYAYSSYNFLCATDQTDNRLTNRLTDSLAERLTHYFFCATDHTDSLTD